MRTTSFYKAAYTAVLWCWAAIGAGNAVAATSENAPEDISVVSAKSVAADDATAVRDLGVTDVVTEGEAILKNDANYTEITAAAWEGKALSAADLLSTLPGIQSYRQGGLGSFQTVSIRGIAARNIMICVDGVPLNDASGGAVNLGSIDLNQMEKVEVYKNNVPAKFGVSGLGGAINFVTKNAVKKGGRVLAAYGNHTTWEGSFQVAGRAVPRAGRLRQHEYGHDRAHRVHQCARGVCLFDVLPRHERRAEAHQHGIGQRRQRVWRSAGARRAGHARNAVSPL